MLSLPSATGARPEPCGHGVRGWRQIAEFVGRKRKNLTQPSAIRANAGITVQSSLEKEEYPGRIRVALARGQRVVNPLAVSAVLHETRQLETGEVLGHRGWS
jgi:hypothetical protein